MKVAVTYENGEIFQHFGRTENFKLYEVEDGAVVREEVVSTEGSGHGALAGFLARKKVDALICGGIGGGAQAALAEEGIEIYGGASGSADEAVQALLMGELTFDPDFMCSHPHGEHGCGAHSENGSACGDHSGGCVTELFPF